VQNGSFQGLTTISTSSIRVVLRLCALCALTALAVSVSMQGWRTRNLYPHLTDLATQIMGADELIQEGRLPQLGSVSSFFGRVPPGTAWLLVPGLLSLRDPRLFEVPSSAVLFFLTLAGLVLTGRALSNERVGWLAACLYTGSSVGLFFASSLWPRGHPFFVVWTLYFCYLALQRSKPGWLIPAALLYLFGNYVFPEIAPLGIAFVPVFRQWRKLLPWWVPTTVVGMAILIWAPYLHFESNVHFTDVKRLLNANATVPAEPHWCAEPLDVRNLATGAPVVVSAIDFRYPPRPKSTSLLRNLSSRLRGTVRSLLRVPSGPSLSKR
jgi:hypothetical protein